jgi:ParB-like chromosome segregation protein Spo0J
LAEDIRTRGLQEPIVLHRDGRIVDGRNRWLACRKAGVEPQTRIFEGEDGELVPFVVSLNLHRRHLDESQRAMVAARLATMRQGARTDLASIEAMSQSQAADLLNVGRASVQRAKEVIDHGAPELLAAVEHGDIAVSIAATLATLPPTEQREIIARCDDDEILHRAKEIRAKRLPHNYLTGEYEWYTPPKFVEAARKVMGGIDLDPASSHQAQEVVQARRYFTEEQDGLSRPWGTLKRPSRAWCNAPYKAGLIDQFVAKLLEELAAGRVSEAVLLVDNRTDTEWFHAAAIQASARCDTSGRIQFRRPDGTGGSPMNGSVFLYFGDNPDRFAAGFGSLGLVYGRPMQVPQLLAAA